MEFIRSCVTQLPAIVIRQSNTIAENNHKIDRRAKERFEEVRKDLDQFCQRKLMTVVKEKENAMHQSLEHDGQIDDRCESSALRQNIELNLEQNGSASQ